MKRNGPLLIDGSPACIASYLMAIWYLNICCYSQYRVRDSPQRHHLCCVATTVQLPGLTSGLERAITQPTNGLR